MFTLHSEVKFEKVEPRSPKQSSDTPKRPIEKTPLKTADNRFIDAECLRRKGYEPSRQLKCGKSGCVLEMQNKNIVAKIGTIFAFEAKLSVFAASIGVSPEVYDAFSCVLSSSSDLSTTRGTAGVLILQRLGRTLFTIINEERGAKLRDEPRVSKLWELAKKCLLNGIFNGDLHQNNILEVVDPNDATRFLDWRVIDWGAGALEISRIYNRVEQVHSDMSRTKESRIDEIKAIRETVIHNIVDEWIGLFRAALGDDNNIAVLSSALRRMANNRKQEIRFIAASVLNFNYREYIAPRILSQRGSSSRLGTSTDRDEEVEEFLAEIKRGEEESKNRADRFFLTSELSDEPAGATSDEEEDDDVASDKSEISE